MDVPNTLLQEKPTTELPTASTFASTISSLGERDEYLAMWEVATLAAIFLVTVVGNTIVLCVLFVKRKKFRRMNYFIFALSFSDMVTAFFNVLPQLAWDITFRFQGGNILCKSVKYGQLVGLYLNSYVLVVTMIDRYQVICRPFSNCRWRPQHSIKLIVGASVFSLILSVPQVFIFSFRSKNGIHDCWANFIHPWGAKAYITYYAVAVFAVPLVILIGLSVAICRQLWRHNLYALRQNYETANLQESSAVPLRGSTEYDPDSISTACEGQLQCHILHVKSIRQSGEHGMSTHPVTNPTILNKNILKHCLQKGSKFNVTTGYSAANCRMSSISTISKAKINTIKLTMVVITFFVVCSAPFICVQLWSVWDPDAPSSPFYTGATFTILMLLASLNSVANPWIYLALNESCLEPITFVSSRLQFIRHFVSTRSSLDPDSALSDRASLDTHELPTLLSKRALNIKANRPTECSVKSV